MCSVTAGETRAPEGSTLCGARTQNTPKLLPRPTLPELAEHLPRAGPRAASRGGAVSRCSRCKSLPNPQMFLPQSIRDTGTAQQDLKFSGGPGASPREGQLQAGSWGRIQDRRAEPEHSQGGVETCIPTQLAQLSATPRACGSEVTAARGAWNGPKRKRNLGRFLKILLNVFYLFLGERV